MSEEKIVGRETRQVASSATHPCEKSMTREVQFSHIATHPCERSITRSAIQSHCGLRGKTLSAVVFSMGGRFRVFPPPLREVVASHPRCRSAPGPGPSSLVGRPPVKYGPRPNALAVLWLPLGAITNKRTSGAKDIRTADETLSRTACRSGGCYTPPKAGEKHQSNMDPGKIKGPRSAVRWPTHTYPCKAPHDV
jgi:hypothetical protein